MRLILCADDYAQSQGIDDAIIQLIQQKKLSAASCMTLSPHWHKAAKRISPAIRKQAAIGLHLDFTHFSPAVSHPKLIALSYLRLLNKQQVTQHIHRQLDLFEKALGTPPDYVDGHQHVQQFAGLRELVLEVLQRRYPQRPWLRVSHVAQPDVKATIITCWGAHAWKRQLQATGWRALSPLRGAYDFNGGLEAYAQRMRQWLSQARQDGGLIMCHPAQGRDESDDIGLARAWEYEYLASEAFAHDLNEAGVQLDRGRALHLLP